MTFQNSPNRLWPDPEKILQAIGPYLKPHPILVVISGPSGVGKDSVIERLKEMKRPYHFCITATTRARRPPEADGVHYQFITRKRFQGMLAAGEFLEHARVYGNMYGVPKPQIREALAKGRDVLLKVDVQGAATVKKLVPQAVFIFLSPPSMGELARRLRSRKTDSKIEIDLRLKTAVKEMRQLTSFDYVVLNQRDKIDECVSRIEAIIAAEKCRVPPRIVRL